MTEFLKSVASKKQEIEWESLCWLVAGCTPGSGDQFRARQTLQAAD